jgi:hypothetical protein
MVVLEVVFSRRSRSTFEFMGSTVNVARADSPAMFDPLNTTLDPV